MDTEMTQLSERLSEEFNELPTTTVIRVVTDCVEQWPDADVYFIEQAARSQLQTIPRAGQNLQIRDPLAQPGWSMVVVGAVHRCVLVRWS